MFLAFDHHVVPCLEVVSKVKIELYMINFPSALTIPIQSRVGWLAFMFAHLPFFLKEKIG